MVCLHGCQTIYICSVSSGNYRENQLTFCICTTSGWAKHSSTCWVTFAVWWYLNNKGCVAVGEDPNAASKDVQDQGRATTHLNIGRMTNWYYFKIFQMDPKNAIRVTQFQSMMFHICRIPIEVFWRAAQQTSVAESPCVWGASRRIWPNTGSVHSTYLRHKAWTNLDTSPQNHGKSRKQQLSTPWGRFVCQLWMHKKDVHYKFMDLMEASWHSMALVPLKNYSHWIILPVPCHHINVCKSPISQTIKRATFPQEEGSPSEQALSSNHFLARWAFFRGWCALDGEIFFLGTQNPSESLFVHSSPVFSSLTFF